jgi:hypothetical protein
MTNTKNKKRTNSGQARILETVVAAAIIFIVFTGSFFFVSSSKITAVQERADLDRLGYNVLSRITESGAIEATIGTSSLTSLTSTSPEVIKLKAFVQDSLPSSILFNLTVTKLFPNSENLPASISNINDYSLSESLAVSSTPIIYTSKSTSNNQNIYYLVLILAHAGGNNQ